MISAATNRLFFFFNCATFRWYVRWLVVRSVSVVAGQQFPARRERIPEQKTVGQHADDAQDPDSPVVRFFAGRNAGRRTTHPAPFQHRTAREERLHRQSIPTHGNCEMLKFNDALTKQRTTFLSFSIDTQSLPIPQHYSRIVYKKNIKNLEEFFSYIKKYTFQS